MLAIMCGCNNDELIDDLQDNEQVILSLYPQITADVTVTSRAPILGNEFPPSGSGAVEYYDLGTWICAHEDNPVNFIPEKSGYNHLQAKLSVSGSGDNIQRDIRFYFRDRASTTLNVAKKKPVDIYSYYPMYTSEKYYELQPDSVPFTSNETDWMWANRITLMENDLVDSVKNVNINYSHAMTCLRIYIKAKYNRSTVSSITLNDTKGRLYQKGYLNLAKKELVLSDADKTEKLKVSYDRAIYQTETAFYIIMPPVESFSEGEMSMSFSIRNNNNSVVNAPNTFTIPTKMNNGMEVKGFEQGKCYTYRLTVDNTISFSPVSVDESGIWTENEFDFEL